MARPEKQIDWSKVEQLIIAQNTAEEIAGYFDIHVTTLYKKIDKKFKSSFSNYAIPFYSKGRSNIRNTQYKIAMSGNVRMLERLGDVYLGQKHVNPPTTEVPNEDIIKLAQDNMQLANENLELKEELKRIKAIANQPETE